MKDLKTITNICTNPFKVSNSIYRYITMIISDQIDYSSNYGWTNLSNPFMYMAEHSFFYPELPVQSKGFSGC